MIHSIFHQTLQICPFTQHICYHRCYFVQLQVTQDQAASSSFLCKKSIIKQYKDCIIIILRLNAMILVLSVKMQM